MDSGSIGHEISEEMRPFCQKLRLCALHTDEGGDLGVDDAAGKQVKVVLHRVHHHRVSRVVAALQRRVGDTEERERQDKQETSQTAHSRETFAATLFMGSKLRSRRSVYFLSRGKEDF